jgi:hypothetical protein
MSKVFVLDTKKQPLNAVHPGRARLLLQQGKAAVYRRYPFTLILKRSVEQPHLEPLRVKIDPGSNTTGIALVNDDSGEVVWAAELIHRGEQIRRDMDKRRAVRKSRRQRKTRYRQPRFDNRRKRKGALPPSLESRVCNVLTWVPTVEAKGSQARQRLPNRRPRACRRDKRDQARHLRGQGGCAYTRSLQHSNGARNRHRHSLSFLYGSHS